MLIVNGLVASEGGTLKADVRIDGETISETGVSLVPREGEQIIDAGGEILLPGGVLAANTWSTSRLYDHESVTYESVFGEFFNLRDFNRVILAKRGLPSIDEVKRNSRALDPLLKRFDVEAAWLLPMFSTQKDWNRNARVLTDRHSPSNLLNVK